MNNDELKTIVRSDMNSDPRFWITFIAACLLLSGILFEFFQVDNLFIAVVIAFVVSWFVNSFLYTHYENIIMQEKGIKRK